MSQHVTRVDFSGGGQEGRGVGTSQRGERVAHETGGEK
jgi:hypothetical protein